jgi:hypothetical protein
VTLIAGDDTWNGSLGDLITIPDARHSLERTCRPVGAWQMRGSTLSRPRQRPTAANVFAQVSPTTPTTTVHTR